MRSCTKSRIESLNIENYFLYNNVYIQNRSTCSPSVIADGEFYHTGKVVYGDAIGIFLAYQGWFRLVHTQENIRKSLRRKRNDMVNAIIKCDADSYIRS